MRKMGLTLGLMGLLTVGAAAADLQGNLRVHIPFSFSAGSVLLPAGEYSIERSAIPDTLQFRDVATGNSIFVRILCPAQGPTSEPARLTFNKYGEHYFLAKIWDRGTGTGVMLPKTKAEREMVASVRAEQVILAARQ